MKQSDRPKSVPADPEQWSDKSKQTVSYGFIREYTDKPYKCWRCQVDCIFTAQDQKYTFEVKKASVDQRRSLCESCWSESHRIRNMLLECEERWAEGKAKLKADTSFLTHWSELLVAQEAYVPYKPDTAKKNMLAKLLANA
jgi:Probable zinc-ribbon domain